MTVEVTRDVPPQEESHENVCEHCHVDLRNKTKHEGELPGHFRCGWCNFNRKFYNAMGKMSLRIGIPFWNVIACIGMCCLPQSCWLK